VPSFEALFEREGRSWPRFYTEVRRIGRLPTMEERRQALATASGIQQTRRGRGHDNNGEHDGA